MLARPVALMMLRCWPALFLFLGEDDRTRMPAAVEQHLEPLSIESNDEVLAVRNHRDADATGERPPLTQLEDVLGDVRLLELATVFI